jgi:hypothetical protein
VPEILTVGKLISYDLTTGANFLMNFFDKKVLHNKTAYSWNKT